MAPPKTVSAERLRTVGETLRSGCSTVGVTNPQNATARISDTGVDVPYDHEVVAARLVSDDIDEVGAMTATLYRVTTATANARTAGQGTAVSSALALADSSEKLSVNNFAVLAAQRRGAANDRYIVDATGTNAGDLLGYCRLELDVIPIPRKGL